MSGSHPVKAGDHVFLVDGSSFIFRAYYQSIRQDQKYNFRSDRLPTGAVRIFATKILQFVRDGAMGIKPTHLAIIFDKSENSFRKALYPLYKANRSDPPEDLVPQFPLMREVVRHTMYQVPGSTARLLEDSSDPRRGDYLARFADREGQTFLRRFWRKTEQHTPEE